MLEFSEHKSEVLEGEDEVCVSRVNKESDESQAGGVRHVVGSTDSEKLLVLMLGEEGDVAHGVYDNLQ